VTTDRMGSNARIACLAVLVVLLGACATARQAPTHPPLPLAGERVMVVPLPAGSVLPGGGDDRAAEAVLLEALAVRGAAVEWLPPDAVEPLAARLPGPTADPRRRSPATVARDGRWLEPGVARQLSLWAALGDVELALLPDRPVTGDAGVRWSAVMADARTGMVIWRGSGDGADLAEAAAALAAALVRDG
jgi:hypothetical protein